MRILLADDQINVRSALHLVLAQITDLQIAGEAADAASLLEAVAQKQPDLVLLDWELPGLPPSQLLRLLKFERPSLQIIAMSSRPEAEQQALDAGVDAFMSKSEPPERVIILMLSRLEKGSEKDEIDSVT